MTWLTSAKIFSPGKIRKWFNQDLFLVLKTQAAEYKKKPLLNFGFVLSLAIATSTLLSVLVLNHATREQYQQAHSFLKNPVAFHIVANQEKKLSKADFAQLRSQGFTQITPVLRFRKKLANGKNITFFAVDLLVLSLLKPQTINIQDVMLTKSYLDALNLPVGQDSPSANQLILANTRAIPFRISPAGQWGNVALLDITLAWRLFPEEGDFSYLMVAPLSEKSKQILQSVLPVNLSLYQPWSIEERQGFADALHLNLNALASLGFMISLFIAYQAANQAWRKRAQLTAQLRLLGVQLLTIKAALLLEALFLILSASILGIFLAKGMVYFLLPLLGLTLEQLYSLNSSGHFNWQWSYNLWACAISSVAVLLALIRQFKLIRSKYIVRTARLQDQPFYLRQTVLITSVLLLCFVIWPADNWLMLMIKYGFFLTASIVLLPAILQLVLFSCAYFVKSFRLRYILKDACKQVVRRHLPLAAFYLALTASIAAALMVNSFESAFVRYLDQQLNADILIRHKAGQKQPIAGWLEAAPEVKEYNLFQHTWAKTDNDSVKLFSVQSPLQLDSLLFKSSISTAGEGCYINEQLALKKQLRVNQIITVSQDQQNYRCRIKGIYYEYGYPGYSIRADKADLTTYFSGWIETGFGVFFKAGQVIAEKEIITALTLDEQQVYQPRQIKKMALEIFSQTFVLITAIAAVLLLIACLGLFMSASGLELARKRDLYILRSLGYSQMALFMHMLVQWLLLISGTIILSWPVAVILAKALVQQVLPASFGWSMPLMLNIAPFAVSSLLGLFLLLPALMIPLYKLNVRAIV